MREIKTDGDGAVRVSAWAPGVLLVRVVSPSGAEAVVVVGRREWQALVAAGGAELNGGAGRDG